MRVLVVEDNLDIQANIADYLEPDYTLDFAYSGDQGLSLALANTYDVIVLDLMLPGRDGIDVCKTYKREAIFQTPILMLTARDTIDDKEIGFNAGADDYLVKPFSLRELKLRIDVLSKRPKVKNTQSLEFGDLHLDVAESCVSVGGKNKLLNNKETLILTALIEAVPHVVPRDTLSYRLWADEAPESGALRTHIYNLRRALAGLRAKTVIETDRSRGYALKMEKPDA